jgi:hypothetical protein
MKEMEKWLNTAKAPQDIVYYKGHLVEDRVWNTEKIAIQKLAKLFLNSSLKDIVVLFQKKIKAGGPSVKPIYEYIARIKRQAPSSKPQDRHN